MTMMEIDGEETNAVGARRVEDGTRRTSVRVSETEMRRMDITRGATKGRIGKDLRRIETGLGVQTAGSEAEAETEEVEIAIGGEATARSVTSEKEMEVEEATRRTKDVVEEQMRIVEEATKDGDLTRDEGAGRGATSIETTIETVEDGMEIAAVIGVRTVRTIIAVGEATKEEVIDAKRTTITIIVTTTVTIVGLIEVVAALTAIGTVRKGRRLEVGQDARVTTRTEVETDAV